MTQDLDFDIRMPTVWNKRTVFQGGGGFDGFIWGALPNLTNGGYTSIASNHGHNESATPGASFALDPQMLQDYAYLSVPRVMPSAKAIMRGFYGAEVDSGKTVFDACSGGGRQGLIQAQRYPDLFDGVISRAPANSFNPLFLWFHKLTKQLAEPGAALSVAKIQTIGNAVRAKCDALDGLADRMIGRPDACTFDPAELACTGVETDSCLTPPQVLSAQTFYAPTTFANGRYSFAGFPLGGEADEWIGAPAWATPNRAFLGQGYISYLVAQNPTVDWLALDPAAYTSRIDQLVAMIDAVDPDLSRFKASGGKLLLWHGLSDWMVSAKSTTAYYQSVVQEMGQASTDEFLEYYTSPAVQHCGGGTGADRFDLLGPMFDWIERGTKPSSSLIEATQYAVPAGTTPLARPLCQYPKYPRYVSGDPNLSSSFTCQTP